MHLQSYFTDCLYNQAIVVIMVLLLWWNPCSIFRYFRPKSNSADSYLDQLAGAETSLTFWLTYHEHQNQLLKKWLITGAGNRMAMLSSTKAVNVSARQNGICKELNNTHVKVEVQEKI